MKRNKVYVSVDVEASGRTPGKYSMLSFGACIVGDEEKTFYRELKPISGNADYDAMKVGSLGLYCCRGGPQELDPNSDAFDPSAVLERLEKEGEEPAKAMQDFAEWIKENSEGREVEIAAWPIIFDGMYISWYFDNFYDDDNPFSYFGTDMTSVYRGAVGKMNARLGEVSVDDSRNPAHNALEDAVHQSKQFGKVLGIAKQNRKKSGI
ncbi:MAG: 3'-5' exoribonuclease [Candidatus Aenigmarchaeota archaeon]|nr:3'-5' exoribonuclease [Candidatus Aenigmarchaeota archaeon]